MYAPKIVIIHVGINDLLNDSGHSNVENILNNFNAMIKKCRNYNVRNILLSGLVYTKRVELSVLEGLHLKLVELCSQYGSTTQIRHFGSNFRHVCFSAKFCK